MRIMTKRWSLLFVCILLVLSACYGPDYTSRDIMEIKASIATAIQTEKTESMEQKCRERKIERYLENEELVSFIKVTLDTLYNEKNSTMFRKILLVLEKCGYKNNYINEYLHITYMPESKSFLEKIEMVDYFAHLAFYGPVKISQGDIDEYVKGKESVIYTQKGKGGYYDDSSTHMKEYNRAIKSNGDIVTVSYQYFGDFAIGVTETEYLDKYYQIHTRQTEDLYFRGWHLGGIDKIQDFIYVQPYLFSTYEGHTVIYELPKDSTYASSIWVEVVE